MKLQNRSLVLIFIGVSMLLSLQSKAQSVALPGHECSFDFRVVSYNCSNPAAGDDVRLTVSEFQDCKNGKITKLDRNEFGFVLNGDSADLKTTVQYASTRTHLDDRTGDETIVLPVSAEIKGGSTHYQIQLSNLMEPDFEGAGEGEWHYVGSFISPDSSGKLQCYVGI